MSRSKIPISQSIAAAVFLWAGLGPAAAMTISNLPVGGSKVDITSGADGALWFTVGDATALGRLTPSGSLRVIQLPADPVPIEESGLSGITLGSEGSLWAVATLRKSIFRLRPDGTTTQYRLPSTSGYPYAITRGPDGNIWIDLPSQVGKITNSDQMTILDVPANRTATGGITSGPDGNLWLAARDANKILRLTLQGTVTEFPLPKAGSGPYSIAAGPGNNLWFTEFDGNRVGRISTSGVITEFDLPHPGSQPISIVQAPDGTMWFTEFGSGRLGRLTPQGVMAELAVPDSILPIRMAVGPDGNLWFTEVSTVKIGRLTPGGTPGPCTPGDTVLCIDDTPGDHRFKVEVEYSTTQGGGLAGNAHAVPLASLDVNRGGLFWFFSQENPELLVKVLDGCSNNGHRWVFLSGGTNVGLIATVADTVTNEVHTYYNRDVTPFAPVQDTRAHACPP